MRVTLCCGRLGRHWTTRQLRQQQLRVERRRLCSGPPPRAVGLAWDLETTGYQPCDIVQIAVTCADWDDEPYSSFVRHVMPSRPIDPRAEEVHGISMDLLTEVQAESIDVVLAELTSWLDHTFGPERRLVWAGHNSGTFDLPVLRKCTLAAGCSMPRGLEESAHTVDTLRLARHTLKSDEDVSSHTLEDMYRLATGMPLTDAHDALCDAKAVAAVWRWLIEERGGDPRSSNFEAHLGATFADGLPSASPATTQQRQSTRSKKVAELDPDDLQTLTGVGPAIEKQLLELGVATVPELRAAVQQAAATTGSSPLQYLKQNLAAHPAALAKIRDGLSQPQDADLQPVPVTEAAASTLAAANDDAVSAGGTDDADDDGLYSAELRVVARQLMDSSWREVFTSGSTAGVPTVFHQPQFQEMLTRIAADASQGRVFPPARSVFNAFDLTPLDEIKVVIIGQDPYHGNGQAHGLCFSVERGVAIPPSLRNIYTELADDIEGFERPGHGNLKAWARQGVFLLNASLTVREGQANSHAALWQTFTDHVIRGISEQRREAGVVFLLWGGFAQKKGALVDRTRHRVIEAPHPSPLSASRGWFGSAVFSRCNAELRALGHQTTIDWRLPP